MEESPEPTPEEQALVTELRQFLRDTFTRKLSSKLSLYPLDSPEQVRAAADAFKQAPASAICRGTFTKNPAWNRPHLLFRSPSVTPEFEEKAQQWLDRFAAAQFVGAFDEVLSLRGCSKRALADQSDHMDAAAVADRFTLKLREHLGSSDLP